jgi:hypothetical protein
LISSASLLYYLGDAVAKREPAGNTAAIGKEIASDVSGDAPSREGDCRLQP